MLDDKRPHNSLAQTNDIGKEETAMLLHCRETLFDGIYLVVVFVKTLWQVALDDFIKVLVHQVTKLCLKKFDVKFVWSEFLALRFRFWLRLSNGCCRENLEELAVPRHALFPFFFEPDLVAL